MIIIQMRKKISDVVQAYMGLIISDPFRVRYYVCVMPYAGALPRPDISNPFRIGFLAVLKLSDIDMEQKKA